MRSLVPALGCGLMMVVCMAMMSRAGSRNRPNPTDAETTAASSEEVSALRDEVARLRHLDEERRATPDGTP
jgi:hypothetical protein